MKKLVLSILLGLTICFGFTGLAAAAGSPTDAAKSEVCEGISTTTGGTCDSSGTDLNSAMAVILNVISIIAGAAAVVMIMIAGFNYITSGGEGNKIASAKSTLIYAMVGVAVVALAQFIVHFVIGSATP